MTSAGDDSRGAARALLDDNGLDQPWLNRVLNDAGFDGTIVEVGYETVGTGQMGDNIRCRLSWAGPATADDRPTTVILKLPSADETSRQTGAATGAYLREVGFYRDVAPTVAMRVPTVHHLWEDQASSRFVLVMEDIAPAETGDQLRGCRLDRAELAVDAAAALHGSTWGWAEEHGGSTWLDRPSTDQARERAALFEMVFPGFVDRYRNRLSPDDLAFGHWLADNLGAWQEARVEAQCLVHGDFRLDNILFGLGPPAPPITTVDWQTVSVGPALSDVAYFLSGSLPPDELAAHEPALIERYRGGLAAHGVDLSTDELERGYGLGAPSGYAMAVIASQIVGQTKRGDQMFLVMAAGSAALARRRNTPALIG